MLSPEYWSANSATLPTTIMMVPSNAAGPTCCGTSMTCAPSTPMLRHWPGGPTPSTGFTTGPGACTHPQAKRRRTAQLALERQLLAFCQPFRHDPSATQAKLCRRIERHLNSSSVAEPACLQTTTRRTQPAPSGHQKISGGTRFVPYSAPGAPKPQSTERISVAAL